MQENSIRTSTGVQADRVILLKGARAIWPAALMLAMSATAATPSGTYSSTTEYATPTPSSGPFGIATGPDGALWFTEAYVNKIGRITTTGISTEYSIPTANSQPDGITPGPDGALWFTEELGNNIGRITTAGEITEYPVPPPASSPSGITAGPDGALWFTSCGGVGRITTTGVVTEYPVLFDACLNSITTGSDGALWFTNTGDYEIGRITTAGSITNFPLSLDLGAASEIAPGSDGALWFTQGHNIGRITTAGVITEYATPTYNSYSQGITAAPDGALWFIENLAAKIGRITTAGMITEYPLPPNTGPFGITAGPDGALWYTEVIGIIGRAPACGLGFSASFANSTLTMHFHLGIDTPATFNILLHTATGDAMPFSKTIPATVPPEPFTKTWTVPKLGKATVEPRLVSAPGEVICSEWTTVDTAQ